jgi:hypothetical protein
LDSLIKQAVINTQRSHTNIHLSQMIHRHSLQK